MGTPKIELGIVGIEIDSNQRSLNEVTIIFTGKAVAARILLMV